MARILDPDNVFEDDYGRPLASGTVTFYENNTVVLKDTYSDVAETVVNPNPMTLDADGRLRSDVRGTGRYTIRVADTNGATITGVGRNDIGPPDADDIVYTFEGVDRTVAEVLADTVSVKAYGAKGDGSDDDSAAVEAFLSGIMGGARGYVPAGTYAIDPIAITMTGDIDVQCDMNARFIYHSAQSEPLLSFTAQNRDLYRLRWSGGKIDNTGGTTVASVQSNTCMELVRLKETTVRDVVFQGASTYGAALTQTDSGITLVDCKRVLIEGNTFIGQGDAGIYPSGGDAAADSTDDGGEIVITGNHFIQCYNAITVKRSAPRTIVSGNTFRNCFAGIFEVEVTDTYLPGRGMIISNNVFKKIEARVIELRVFGDNIIEGNIIEDFGYQADETTPATNPVAMRIISSANIIRNNRFSMLEWTTTSAFVGLQILPLTINSILYTPERNVVSGNKFFGIFLAIHEASSTGINTYLNNGYFNCTTNITLNNSNSANVWENSGKRWTAYTATGNITTGEDQLLAFNLPIDSLNVVGRAVRVTGWGTGANNANSKTVKFYFGSACLSADMTTSQANSWRIVADIIRTGANTQSCTAQFIQGGTTTIATSTTTSLTEDTGALILVKFTGTGTDTNDIVQTGFVMEMVN